MCHAYNLRKIICCSVDLTIATRIIAFIGIAVAVLLTTVLLNDKAASDYETSRTTALAFGLDWKHIHPHANTHEHLDPDGKMISIVMIVYAVTFFFINVCLMLGAITNDRRLAVPWLLCEILGCVSKFGALIFHLATEYNNLSNIFLSGSVIYIVVMTWWWTVVFLAQSSWPYKFYTYNLSKDDQDISNNSSV